MRAFIHKLDGNDRVKVGGTNGTVTTEYKTWRNLLKFGTRGLAPGWYQVEGFFNWDNRYGKPDKINRFLVREKEDE